MKCEHCGQELPQPPTLREQVERVLNNAGAYSTDRDHTDAVLAVVADWLAAQPLTTVGAQYAERRKFQRDHDVRLLRGGSDA